MTLLELRCAASMAMEGPMMKLLFGGSPCTYWSIAHYYATEIDKYAIQTTQHNFLDTIQLGDAFQVRDEGWKVPEREQEE